MFLVFFGFFIGFKIFADNFLTMSLSVRDGFFKGISEVVSAARLLKFNKINISKPINDNFLCIIF